jgi:hypothetical protein
LNASNAKENNWILFFPKNFMDSMRDVQICSEISPLAEGESMAFYGLRAGRIRFKVGD